MIDKRVQRIIDTGRMTVGDALVLGVASMLGAKLPETEGGRNGINAPLYEGEPSTWCGRCKEQYWCARCPKCGR